MLVVRPQAIIDIEGGSHHCTVEAVECNGRLCLTVPYAERHRFQRAICRWLLSERGLRYTDLSRTNVVDDRFEFCRYEVMIKKTVGRWTRLKKFAWTAILLPGIVTAQTRTEALKLCLGDFDGLVWKLPYSPPIRIKTCASPSAGYDSDKSVDGLRTVDLIGELTLGPDAKNLSSDETYAALQSAMYTHFDALFRRNGYRRTALQYGDARTEHFDLRTGKRTTAPGPPIPYVSLARYVRPILFTDATLTYRTEYQNTWRITLEGLPAAPDSPGAKR